jgi:hypothetical protein
MVIRKVSPVAGDLSDVVVGSARKKGILARATLYKDGQYYDVISTAFLYYCTQFESERSLLASFARAMVAADPLQGPAQTLLSLSSAVTATAGADHHGEDTLPDRDTFGAWLRVCVERDLQGAAAAPAWSANLAGGSPCVTVANQLLYERRLALNPQAGYSPYSQYTAAYAALYAQHAAAVGAAQLQQMQAPQPTTRAPQPGSEQQPLSGIKRRASDPGLAQLQQRPRQPMAAVSSGAGSSSSSSSSARLRESRFLKQEQLNSPGAPTSPASTGSSHSSSGAGGPLPAPPRRQSVQQSSLHPREPQAGEDLYLSSTAGTSRRQKKNKEKYCLTIQVLGCGWVAVCYCAADSLPLYPLHCAADHRRGRPGVAPLPQPGS